MGVESIRNFYPIQDLSSAKPIISVFVRSGYGLRRIFNFIRKEARWSEIGDYPILYTIKSVAKEKGKPFPEKEILRALRMSKDPTLKKVYRNSELFNEFRA